jgi:chromate transporter
MDKLKEKRNKFAKIFFTCFYISGFTFGGGLAIISFMRKKFVNDLKWLEEKEMLDLLAIAQTSPGSIAVNASILLGYKIGKLPGAVVALAGTVLPPLIVISVISLFYSLIKGNIIAEAVFAGMRAAVAALITDAFITMLSGVVKERNKLTIPLMALSFVLIFFLKINMAYIILGGVVLGVILALYYKNKGKNLKEETPKDIKEETLTEQNREEIL